MMMNKNKFIYGMVFLLLMVSVGFVSAENNPCGSENSFLGTFKPYQNVQLTQYCDTCTYVKLDSVKSPEGIVTDYGLATMTKVGNTFNHSYSGIDIGCYTYNVCGDKGGSLTCEAIDFDVTPSGFTNNIGFYILLLALSLGLVILGYAIQDYWVVILGSFGMLLFGLYILFFGLAGMKDTVYTWGIGIIILMVGAYFGTRAALEQIDL